MCQGLVSGRILDVSKQRSGVAGEEGQGMEGLGDSPPRDHGIHPGVSQGRFRPGLCLSRSGSWTTDCMGPGWGL